MSEILQWGFLCKWSNVFRNVSGNISSEINYDEVDINGSTLDYSFGELLPATEVSCQVRMQTSVAWSEWSQPGPSMKTNSLCGNGYREWSEECDDGDLKGLDGCNSNCTITLGWSCQRADGTSSDTCFPGCGDGIWVANELCDDGNAHNGDGCSSSCSIEAGWKCAVPDEHAMLSLCYTTCGDGVHVPLKEDCDDENELDGDGCSAGCQVEDNYACTLDSHPPKLKSVCQTCGNGEVEGSEICDDGNVSGACYSGCRSVKPGWQCATVCIPGPAAVQQPTALSQSTNSITWQWRYPDSFGSPVSIFLCQLAVLVDFSDMSTANWTSALLYSREVVSVGSTQQQQQLATLNLSASTTYVFRVRACNSAGCGPFGMPSTGVKTFSSPNQDLQQVAGLLQSDPALISQVSSHKKNRAVTFEL